MEEGGSTARHAAARRAALLWGLLLVALTSWPSPPSIGVVSLIPSFDKLVHLGLYGVEAFFLYRAVAWPGRRAVASLARVIAITGAMAVWATADELHQFWIPGRSMEGADAMADTAGSLLGALAATAVMSRRGGAGG